MWTFTSGIQRDIQRQKSLFLQATTGVSHPFARKYRALNDRVARAVAAYGRAEVLVYLRYCILVARIDMCYCNSMYSDYVNSLKLLVNNRLSLTVCSLRL